MSTEASSQPDGSHVHGVSRVMATFANDLFRVNTWCFECTCIRKFSCTHRSQDMTKFKLSGPTLNFTTQYSGCACQLPA